MAKFSLDHEEHLYKEGMASYLKSTMNTHNGNAIITSKRFVFCKNPLGIAFGALGIAAGMLVKSKEIDFEIPLNEIISIHRERQGLGSKYVLTRRDGHTFAMSFMKADEWLNTFIEAIENAAPSVKTTQIGDRIAFQ